METADADHGDDQEKLKKQPEVDQIRYYTENFERLCRLCLTNEHLVNVYSNVQGRNVFYVRNFVKDAFRLLEQTINKKDRLPNFICEKCERNLNIIYNFKKKCDQSRRILEKIRDKTIVPEDLVKVEDNQPSPSEETAKGKPVAINRTKSKHKNKSSPEELLKKLPQGLNIEKVRETTIPASIVCVELDEAPFKIEPVDIKQEVTSFTETELTVKNNLTEPIAQEPSHAEQEDVESNEDDAADDYSVDEESDSDWKPEDSTEIDCTMVGELTEPMESSPSKRGRKKKTEGTKGLSKKRLREREKTICSICGALVNNIKSHMVIHEDIRPHQCEQCPKSFTSRNKLQSHINSVHLRKRDFKCEVCGKAFLEKNNLKGHQRIHKGDRKYKCDLCPKSFLFAGTLRCHQLTHTQDKKHECQICGKMFLMRTTLNKHLYVHSNERPYKCDMCDKAFRTSTHKIVHMRTHTGERPLQCRICNIGFAHHKARSVHMKTKHAEELAAMDMLDEKGHLKF
ncbi:myoneurin-like [Armigeres subalbatus]|uniref:myoneurin-like n=1 Tax=Armigeres subalbatus TaxID=124917 RepID=UPI002ED107A0